MYVIAKKLNNSDAFKPVNGLVYRFKKNAEAATKRLNKHCQPFAMTFRVEYKRGGHATSHAR